MRTILSSVASLLLGISLLLAAHGLMGTLLTLRLASDGFLSYQIGLVMSAYFVGYVIGTRLAPGIINRIGYIRSFAVCAAMCSTISIMQGLYVNTWLWLLERVAYGICIFSFYVVIESWLNAQVTNAQRGRLFAVYTLVNLTALSLGQQLLALADISSLVLFAIAAALFSLSLVPVSLTNLKQPEPADKPKVDIRHLYKVAPVAMVGCIVTGLAGGAFWTMMPLYAQQLSFTTAQISTIMSVTIIGGAALQLPLGYLSDRYDRRKILFVASLLASLFAIFSAFIDSMSFALVLVVMFTYGGLYFATYPLCAAHANDQVGPHEIVKISGGLLFCYGIGAIVGPLLSGVLMEHISPRSLPIMFAVVWLILAGFSRYIIAQKVITEVEVEEQQPFFPVTRTSNVSLEAVGIDSDDTSEALANENDEQTESK